MKAGIQSVYERIRPTVRVGALNLRALWLMPARVLDPRTPDFNL